MRQDSWHNMFDVAGQVVSDDSVITYTGHTNEVCCARFSHNGALIVSGGYDRTARVNKFLNTRFIFKSKQILMMTWS